MKTNKPARRFCKSQLLFDLRKMADRLRKEHGFDPENGTSQVWGKDEETNRAYGEWHMLTSMISWIESGQVGH